MYLRHERKTATSQAMYLSLKQQDDREDQPSNSPQKVTSSDIKSNKRKHNASLYTARNTKERESERRKNSLPTQSWRPGWYPYVFVEWKCKSSCSYRWWWYDWYIGQALQWEDVVWKRSLGPFAHTTTDPKILSRHRLFSIAPAATHTLTTSRDTRALSTLSRAWEISVVKSICIFLHSH